MTASARRAAAPLRVLCALALGAAVVFGYALANGTRTVDVTEPAPLVRVVVPDNPAAVPVDDSVSAEDDVRWSEMNGTLQRDCSRRYGCGPWYDTSYGADGPPMDYLEPTPEPTPGDAGSDRSGDTGSNRLP